MDRNMTLFCIARRTNSIHNGILWHRQDQIQGDVLGGEKPAMTWLW